MIRLRSRPCSLSARRMPTAGSNTQRLARAMNDTDAPACLLRAVNVSNRIMLTGANHACSRPPGARAWGGDRRREDRAGSGCHRFEAAPCRAIPEMRCTGRHCHVRKHVFSLRSWAHVVDRRQSNYGGIQRTRKIDYCVWLTGFGQDHPRQVSRTPPAGDSYLGRRVDGGSKPGPLLLG
jgi:hypothetical protein